MRNRLRPVLALLVLLALFGFLSRSWGQEKNDEKPDPFAKLIGKQAPDFTAEFGINGKAVKLSDLKGKVVLVDFWAVWCPPCIRAFPHLSELSTTHKDDGFEVVGATYYQDIYDFDKENGKLKVVGKRTKDPDTGEIKISGGLDKKAEQNMLKEFVSHHKLPYRIALLSKEDWKKSSASYNIRGIPHAVLIDRLGVVRMVKVGFSPANAEALTEMVKKLIKEG